MVDKIKDRLVCSYSGELEKAKKHQKYIQLFIETYLSTDELNYVSGDKIASSVIDKFYNTNNPFSVWLQGWMRKDNLRSFLKYLRMPFPTVSLVQDEVEPQLRKVFDSQNSSFEYDFKSESTLNDALKYIDEKGYNEFVKNKLFDELFYRHNSILVTDMDSDVENEPVRLFVDISKVVSIDLKKGKDEIEWLIWKDYGKVLIDNVEYKGELYYMFDSENYEVYYQQDDKYILVEQIPHDLGKCPAIFVSPKQLNSDSRIVRKNIFFSNKLDKLEEYVLYRTLLKMTGVNGAFPIISMYKPNKKPCGFKTENGSVCNGGIIYNNNKVTLDGNEPKRCPSCNKNDFSVQPGTIVGLPIPVPPKNTDPKDFKPIDLNANFIKFHHTPVDILNWLENYVKELESDIYYSLVGKDKSEINKEAVNEKQVESQNETFRNNLIRLSNILSIVRQEADSQSLRLRYGDKFLKASINYGDSFLINTEKSMYEMKTLSQNPVDKKDIQEQIIATKFKNNDKEKNRQLILFNLLPYATVDDDNFMKYLDSFGSESIELRLNFNKYIEQLEATVNVVDLVQNKGIEFVRALLVDQVKVNIEK